MTYTSDLWADERNVLGVISCVSASAVNIARAATNGHVPATDAEVIALRVASQDTDGGQTLASVQAGMRRRYGWTGDLTSDWASIRDGLNWGTWFVVVGWYHDLPARLRNVGQANVFHAVCVGPKDGKLVQFVDALQRGTVESRSMTIDELNHFASSGGFSALGIKEYSHAPQHWIVSIPKRRWPLSYAYFIYRDYPPAPNTWTRGNDREAKNGNSARSRGLSYRCEAPVAKSVMGQRRMMCKLTEGPFKGRYLADGEGAVHASEVAG
jgi:hypothetical protein